MATSVSFPNKLIVKILAMLEYRDLASRIQVSVSLLFSQLPLSPELNPSPVHRTRWPSAGVQTRFQSDWRFLFTGLSLRIGSWRPRNGTATHSRPHEGVCSIFIGPIERELETKTSSTARVSAIASDAENRRTIKRKIALSLLSLMRLMTRPSTVTKMAIEFRSIVGESQSLDKAHMGGPMLPTYRSSYRTHLHILFAAATSVYLTDSHDRINECPALLACCHGADQGRICLQVGKKGGRIDALVGVALVKDAGIVQEGRAGP